MERKKLYLASPLGFTDSGKYFMYDKLIPLIERAGFTVLDPWALTPVEEIESVMAVKEGVLRTAAWKALNSRIAERNEKAIEQSDGLVAVLDGPDVDSGTAAEVGYAYARGRTIIGYRGDMRLAGDNEAAIVNLQLEYFINKSGGIIVSGLDGLARELARIFL